MIRNLLRPVGASRQQVCALSTAPSSESFWLPFTNNRHFKTKPKMLARADGMYYYLEDGTEILDGCSGLWCVNAGHNQRKIVDAVKKQVETLDFAPTFNLSHRKAYEFGDKLLDLVPNRGFEKMFFTNCGSTGVDTALKLALAFHRSKGEAGRVRFVGREKAYHGVGFGGIAVGGINPNKKAFSGNSLPYVSHLPATHTAASLPHQAYSRGQPSWGAHLANTLEDIVMLHDPSTIAAVIVEPAAGSIGVLPPPVGYLEKLREITSKHGILLIFDEVITGFGRVGAPFGVNKFNVTPDMVVMAKGMTNGVVPCGGVMVQKHVYESMINAANKDPNAHIEFFHGYTYSGHPLAMAAGSATIDVYNEMKLFENAANLSAYFEEGLHSMKGLPNVVDIRNVGLMGAVEFSPVPGNRTRAFDIFERCFSKGVLIRASGVSLAVSPPLICEKKHIDHMINVWMESIIESAKEFNPK